MTNQEKIWQIIFRIPKGKVLNYGDVAKLAELPGYARYVGYVLRHLPPGTKLPWHRVVNAQGKLSFPRDSAHYQLQKERLEAEGVVFVNGKFSLRQYKWNHADIAEKI